MTLDIRALLEVQGQLQVAESSHVKRQDMRSFWVNEIRDDALYRRLHDLQSTFLLFAGKVWQTPAASSESIAFQIADLPIRN